MWLQVFLLVLAYCAISANAEDLANDPLKALKTLTTSSNLFSRNLSEKLLGQYKGKNMVVSSLSVFVALSMLEHGADGKTADLLLDSLHLPKDNDLVDQGFKQLISDFNHVTDGINTVLANKIFVNDKFNPKKEFIQLTKDVFQSEAENIDVSKPDEASEKVNKYVREKTCDTIKSIIDPKNINDDIHLLLVNALYFKGQWAYKFSKHSETKFFINNDTTVNTTFISQRSAMSYDYVDSLKAQFVKVPYKSGGFEMIIIVPDEKEGLSHLEKQLKTFDYSEFASNNKVNVDLIIPKFKFENTFDLNEPLKQLRLDDIFISPNLSKISDDELKVSQVTQKTFVEVNEEGTEGSAATVIRTGRKLGLGVSNSHFELLVDRPFYFIIQKLSTVLFEGHVYDPTKRSTPLI